MIEDLTLGTAQLGLDYGINNRYGKPSIDKSHNLLSKAYELGIRSLDTASAYGDSEEVLGLWLDVNGYDDIYITSKIPSAHNNAVEDSIIEEYLERCICRSLKRLKLNRMDNIMLHDCMDILRYGEAIINGLNRLREKGYVNHIGVSVYDLENLKDIIDIGIDTIQLPGSIFNQDIIKSDAIKGLRDKSIRTFVRSAFVQGLIFMEPYNLPIKLQNLEEPLHRLKSISDSFDISIKDIAIGYLRKNKYIDSIVFGVDSIDQLKEIIETPVISDEVVDAIDSSFRDIDKDLIDPRRW